MKKSELKQIIKEEITKILNEEITLPDLIDDEFIEKNITSNGHLMKSIIIELKEEKWYKYSALSYLDLFWESLKYSSNPEKNKEIIFEQDILPNSEKSKISKYIKSFLEKQGIQVVNVYLGEV